MWPQTPTTTGYRGCSLPSICRFRWLQKYYSSRSPPSNPQQMKYCSFLEPQYARPCPRGRMYSSPVDAEFLSRPRPENAVAPRSQTCLWSFGSKQMFSSCRPPNSRGPRMKYWSFLQLLYSRPCPISRMRSSPSETDVVATESVNIFTPQRQSFAAPENVALLLVLPFARFLWLQSFISVLIGATVEEVLLLPSIAVCWSVYTLAKCALVTSSIFKELGNALYYQLLRRCMLTLLFTEYRFTNVGFHWLELSFQFSIVTLSRMFTDDINFFLTHSDSICFFMVLNLFSPDHFYQ